MRVDLGRLEMAVAQQLLDRAQVRPALQEMAGEAVPQGVRMRRGVRPEPREEATDVPLERARLV